jgi:hypothetical protein
MSYSRTLRHRESGTQMAAGKIRTASRSLQQNPLAGNSVRKRRRWFADDPPPEEKPKQPGAGEGDDKGNKPDPTTEPQDVKGLPDWAQKLIEDTRKEAAEHRNKLRKAEEEKSKADQKAAEEQGQFKQLWETAQPQLEELKTLREREAARREQIKQANEKRIGELPKDKKVIVDNLIGKMGTDDPDKVADVLNDLLPTLNAQPTAPGMDAGTKGDKKGAGSGKVELNRVSY